MIPTSNGKLKSNKRKAKVSGVQMTNFDKRGESTLTDNVPDGTNMGNYEGSGFRNCTVKRKLIKSGDELDQIIGTPTQNEDKETIISDGSKHKEICKATRPHSAGAATGKYKQAVTTHENAFSENTEESGMKTQSMQYVSKIYLCSVLLSTYSFTYIVIIYFQSVLLYMDSKTTY